MVFANELDEGGERMRRVKDNSKGFSFSDSVKGGVIYWNGKPQGRIRDEGRTGVGARYAKFEGPVSIMEVLHKSANTQPEIKGRVDSIDVNLGASSVE